MPKGNYNAEKDYCPNGHPYDEANSYVYTQTHGGGMGRKCKACTLARNKARHEGCDMPSLPAPTRRYIITTCAGRQESLNAPSAEAARLARLDQIIEQLEREAAQARTTGARPRSFDWHALPKTAEEDRIAAVGVSELYREEQR